MRDEGVVTAERLFQPKIYISDAEISMPPVHIDNDNIWEFLNRCKTFELNLDKLQVCILYAQLAIEEIGTEDMDEEDDDESYEDDDGALTLDDLEQYYSLAHYFEFLTALMLMNSAKITYTLWESDDL